MKFFFDTEFCESAVAGQARIHLISIGIVCEDGRELYLENSTFDWDQPMPDEWLRENVRPHLQGPGSDAWQTPEQMKQSLIDFFGDEPELYHYVGAWDFVALMSLFGRLVDRPQGWPKWCHDLKQMIADKNVSKEELPVQTGQEHNALEDARWNLAVWQQLVQ